MSKCNNCIHRYICNLKCAYEDNDRECLDFDEERPKGEWEESHVFSCGSILKTRSNVIEHKCNKCHKWSIKWMGTIPDNYCSNCGADMRGDKE